MSGLIGTVISLAQNTVQTFQNYGLLRRQEQLAEQEARRVQAEAQLAAERIARRGRLVQAAGTARAGAAGQGESRSTLDVLIENAQAIGNDISAAKYQGKMGAWAAEESAKEARSAQNWLIGTSILTGVGSLAAASAKGIDTSGLGRNWNNAPSGNRETWFTNSVYGRGDYGEPGPYGGWSGPGWSGSGGSGLGEGSFGAHGTGGGFDDF